MGSRRKSTKSCDSCGKWGIGKLEWVAYRSIASDYGPFLIERLCKSCADWMRESDMWNVKSTYWVRQLTIPGLRRGLR